MIYPTTIPSFLLAAASQITPCKKSNSANKGKIG